MIKLVFSDMDGTLLDGEGNVPPDFDETVAELKRRGVIFCPASGRQYSAILSQMEKYRDDFIFLAENGTVAARHDEILFSNVMAKADVAEVLAAMRRLDDSYPILCGRRKAYVEKHWEKYLWAMDMFFTQHEIVDDLDDIAASEDIVKLAIFDGEHADAERTIYPHLAGFAPRLQVVLASNYWVDIMNPGINKGVAARKIQELLGVKPEECIAFGDYLNDLELIKSVGHGYAMANAHPSVRAAARYEAPTNTEYGVTKVLKQLMADGVI